MNTCSENHFSRRLNSCSHSKHSSRSFGPSCLRVFGEPLCRRNCEPVRRIQAKTNRGKMWLSMSGFASPQRAHTDGRLVIDSASPIARAGLNFVTHAFPPPIRAGFPLNIPTHADGQTRINIGECVKKGDPNSLNEFTLQFFPYSLMQNALCQWFTLCFVNDMMRLRLGRL